MAKVYDTGLGNVIIIALLTANPDEVATFVTNAVQSWLEFHQDDIANTVLEVRKKNFEKSYDFTCPECGMEVGQECINFGRGGGPVNHTARIELAKNRDTNDSFEG